jgi:hypothetical protein
VEVVAVMTLVVVEVQVVIEIHITLRLLEVVAHQKPLYL